MWEGTLIVIAILYMIGYLQRFKCLIPYNINVVFNWTVRQIGLLTYAESGYLIGMYFAKNSFISKLRKVADKMFTEKIQKLICAAVFLVMVVIHSIIPSVAIAIFTGITIIITFNLTKKSKVTEKVFVFFGKHSTNIWLTHMFFYVYIFEDLVFAAKYPLSILIFMLMLTIASSYIIMYINEKVLKILKL